MHHTISEFTREDVDALVAQGPELRGKAKAGGSPSRPHRSGRRPGPDACRAGRCRAAPSWASRQLTAPPADRHG